MVRTGGADGARSIAVPVAEDFREQMEAMVQAPLSHATLAEVRTGSTAVLPTPEELARGRDVVVEEREIPGGSGHPRMPVVLVTPRRRDDAAIPVVLNMHGGGMVFGHHYWAVDRLIDLVEELGIAAVSVGYRLAPEHPYPAAVEDCFAALEWIVEHSAELGVDSQRVVVSGNSAGGGLAAALCLLTRDRSSHAIVGQLLMSPMLDNMGTTESSRQYDGIGPWPRQSNAFAWECILGEGSGGREDAPAYASPSRAHDLSGLPPAFIEVGSAELFRDEDVDYASRIWAVGGEAELHVWSGAFHGFDRSAPEADLTLTAVRARSSWLKRTLGL